MASGQNLNELAQTLARAGIKERLSPDLIDEGLRHIEDLEAMLFAYDYKYAGSQDGRITYVHLYNALGALYPLLKGAGLLSTYTVIKQKFLSLDFPDERAHHISKICEPLLIDDLSSSGVIWPERDKEKTIVNRFFFFMDFQAECMERDGLFKEGIFASDFFMAYTLLYWREDEAFRLGYAAIAHPEFLERAVGAIVHHFVRRARASSSRISPEEYQVRSAGAVYSLKEMLPKICHNLVDKFANDDSGAYTR